jgi:hypothetical protein
MSNKGFGLAPPVALLLRGAILDWRAGGPNAAHPEINRQQYLHTALAAPWQGKG